MPTQKYMGISAITAMVFKKNRCQALRRPKNPGCLGCATQNLPLLYTDVHFPTPTGYPSQAALWAYSCTGG